MSTISRNLLNGITATDAVKKPFTLTAKDFAAGFPSVKTTGLGSGDSVRVFEKVNGIWEVGYTLDSSSKSTIIQSPGYYAVDAILATVGPVSCDLNTVRP